MEEKSTYSPKDLPSTYDPIANGKWKGAIEDCVDNIKDDIKEIKNTLDKIFSKVNRIDKEVEVLKYKSGVWGFFAGLIPALVAFIYWLITKN